MHSTTPRTTKTQPEKENSLIFSKNTNTKQFSHERVHSFRHHKDKNRTRFCKERTLIVGYKLLPQQRSSAEGRLLDSKASSEQVLPYLNLSLPLSKACLLSEKVATHGTKLEHREREREQEKKNGGVFRENLI